MFSGKKGFGKIENLGRTLVWNWTMTSYGKTPTAFLRSDEAAVNLAAIVALRDAGANFATGFTRVPEVREWLERKWGKPPEVKP